MSELISQPNDAAIARGDGEKRIVVIGGGFAGAASIRVLQKGLPAGSSLLWISEESYTTFNPMLAEVVGASIFPEHVVAPLRQVLKQTDRCRFVMGRVQGVDWDRHEVICDSLSGERRFPFDHLVLAFGSRARTDFVPGLADHALPLKTIGDALEIRNTTLRRIARMELEADRDARASGQFHRHRRRIFRCRTGGGADRLPEKHRRLLSARRYGFDPRHLDPGS